VKNSPRLEFVEKNSERIFLGLIFFVLCIFWMKADTMFWHPDSMVSASLRMLKSGEFTTYWATYGPASYLAASIGAVFIAALGFVLSAWHSASSFESSYRTNSVQVLGETMTFDHFSLIWNMLLLTLSVYFLYKTLNIVAQRKINYLIAISSMLIFPIHYYQGLLPTVEVYLIFGVALLFYTFARAYYLENFSATQSIRFLIAFQMTLGIRFTLIVLVVPLLVALVQKWMRDNLPLRSGLVRLVLLLTLTAVPYLLVLQNEANRQQVLNLTTGLASPDFSIQNIIENLSIFLRNFGSLGVAIIAFFLIASMKSNKFRDNRVNVLLIALMGIQLLTYITNVNGFSKYLTTLFVVSAFFLALNFGWLLTKFESQTSVGPKNCLKGIIVGVLCLGLLSDYLLASRELPDTRASLSVLFPDKKETLTNFLVTPSIPAEFSRGINSIPFDSSRGVIAESGPLGPSCQSATILSDRDIPISKIKIFSAKCLSRDSGAKLILISPHKKNAELVDSDSWQSLLSLGHRSDDFRVGYGPTFIVFLPSNVDSASIGVICQGIPLCSIDHGNFKLS
jgi:hypothetical protein